MPPDILLNNAKRWLVKQQDFKVVTFRGVSVQKFNKKELIKIMGFIVEQMHKIQESSRVPYSLSDRSN